MFPRFPSSGGECKDEREEYQESHKEKKEYDFSDFFGSERFLMLRYSTPLEMVTHRHDFDFVLVPFLWPINAWPNSEYRMTTVQPKRHFMPFLRHATVGADLIALHHFFLFFLFLNPVHVSKQIKPRLPGASAHQWTPIITPRLSPQMGSICSLRRNPQVTHFSSFFGTVTAPPSARQTCRTYQYE